MRTEHRGKGKWSLYGGAPLRKAALVGNPKRTVPEEQPQPTRLTAAVRAIASNVVYTFPLGSSEHLGRTVEKGLGLLIFWEKGTQADLLEKTVPCCPGEGENRGSRGWHGNASAYRTPLLIGNGCAQGEGLAPDEFCSEGRLCLSGGKKSVIMGKAAAASRCGPSLDKVAAQFKRGGTGGKQVSTK